MKNQYHSEKFNDYQINVELYNILKRNYDNLRNQNKDLFHKLAHECRHYSEEKRMFDEVIRNSHIIKTVKELLKNTSKRCKFYKEEVKLYNNSKFCA